MTPAVKNFAIQRTGEHDHYSTIQFLKPGRGTVTATFHISPERSRSCARRPIARGSSSRCLTST